MARGSGGERSHWSESEESGRRRISGEGLRRRSWAGEREVTWGRRSEWVWGIWNSPCLLLTPMHSLLCGSTTRPCGSTAQAEVPRRQGRVGVMTQAGEFQLPIPIHCLSLHVSPSQERRRRPSPDLRLRPLSSDSDRWDRSPPLPLAMNQGFSPNPSFSWLFSCF